MPKDKAPKTVREVLARVANPADLVRPTYSPEDVHTYLHCRQCIEEMPVGTSPREWNRTESGFTKDGLLVWCLRHNVAVGHLSLETMANFLRHPPQCQCGGH